MANTTNKVCYTCKQEKPASDFYPHKASKDGLHPNCLPCETEKRYLRESRVSPEEKERRRQAKRDYDVVYNKKHKKARQVREKELYAIRREDKIKCAARWSKANPARRRAISQNYKYGRRAAEGAKISSRELQDWIDSQDKVCVYCSSSCPESYHIDHIIPLAKGGQHCTSNLAIACPTCNLRKSDKMPEVFLSEMEAA